jgi:DNA-binding MarR family transcriptional regulator
MPAELLIIDDALVRLRRLWSAAPRATIGENTVEMSSVLVVEACARGAAAGQEVTVSDVARFAEVEGSTASRLVDRAARNGLVERGISTLDARRTTLTLTAAGRTLREQSVIFRTNWLRGVLDGWVAEDVSSLARLLDRFADTVNARGGPGTHPKRQ